MRQRQGQRQVLALRKKAAHWSLALLAKTRGVQVYGERQGTLKPRPYFCSAIVSGVMCEARLLMECVASPKGNPRLWGEMQSPELFLQVHAASSKPRKHPPV